MVKKIISSSTQRTDQTLPSHANVGYPGGSVAAMMSASSAITASTNNPPPPSISSLQQQIPSLPLQQSSTSLPATSSATSQNDLLAQLLLVTQQQQQQIRQQQLVLSQLLLASLTAPAPPVSAPPSSLLVSAPISSSSAQGGASFTLPNTSDIKNDILRQIYAAQQGNIGTRLQPASLTAQSQANLQLANPSNQSFIFGGASNPNPLTAAQHEQHELDLVYRASMVQNQFNQPLLMSSPPNSLNKALSFQQQSQPLRQNHASASIRSYPPHPPQAAKNDEESI
jgi:hypothetical protein